MPDVCGDAAPGSGFAIVLNGVTQTIGGTSAVAPLWAGLTALINEAAPEPFGFFLPTLYQNPQVMRDITQGNNNPTGSNLGYTALAGMHGHQPALYPASCRLGFPGARSWSSQFCRAGNRSSLRRHV